MEFNWEVLFIRLHLPDVAVTENKYDKGTVVPAFVPTS